MTILIIILIIILITILITILIIFFNCIYIINIFNNIKSSYLTTYNKMATITQKKPPDSLSINDIGNNIQNENVINITNNNDRTCGNCGIVFDFPCQLERHLNGKKQCKSKDLQNNEFSCKHCGYNYSNKYSLVRHLEICKKNQDNITRPIPIPRQIINKQESNTDNSETIKTLSSTLSKLIKKNKDNIHKDSIKELSNCLETLVLDI
jgi:hypothetical protein